MQSFFVQSRKHPGIDVTSLLTPSRRTKTGRQLPTTRQKREDAKEKTNIKEYAKNKRTGKAIGVFQRHFIHIDRYITCAFRVIRTK